MITRVGMAPRAAGMTYEQFAHHWAREHAAVAGTLPGLRSYVQNHAILCDGRPLLPYPGFDACAQMTFDDLAAMDAAFASAPPDGELRRDERRLLDSSRRMFALMTPRVLLDTDQPEGSVKLMTFLRSAPGADAGALETTLDEIATHIGDAQGEILRHERLTFDSEAHRNRAPAPCEAIDVVFTANVDAALRLLGSPEAVDAAWHLGAIGQVIGRRIATEVWVVR